jgi:hypothetical protein
LLKKNNLKWDSNTQKAFEELKTTLCEAQYFVLANSRKIFILETYACATGLKAVLNKKGRPLAFLSKALFLKHLGLSIYEKDYLAILMVVER